MDWRPFHLQELHDQTFVVGTKRRTSGKTRVDTNVHIHLRDQETIKYWVSLHGKGEHSPNAA